jgi:hypothetical protein
MRWIGGAGARSSLCAPASENNRQNDRGDGEDDDHSRDHEQHRDRSQVLGRLIGHDALYNGAEPGRVHGKGRRLQAAPPRCGAAPVRR